MANDIIPADEPGNGGGGSGGNGHGSDEHTALRRLFRDIGQPIDQESYDQLGFTGDSQYDYYNLIEDELAKSDEGDEEDKRSEAAIWYDLFGEMIPPRVRVSKVMEGIIRVAMLKRLHGWRRQGPESIARIINMIHEESGIDYYVYPVDVNKTMELFDHPDREQVWKLDLIGYGHGVRPKWVAVQREAGYRPRPQAEATKQWLPINGVQIETDDPLLNRYLGETDARMQRLGTQMRHNKRRDIRQVHNLTGLAGAQMRAHVENERLLSESNKKQQSRFDQIMAQNSNLTDVVKRLPNANSKKITE